MPTSISADPIARFAAQLARACETDRVLLPEPTALSLGTVGADGRPAVRIVLLKAVDARGFVFYTNLEGRKGRELLAHPFAAMTFHWQPYEQQVRVEGRAELVSEAEADAYFASRPRASQVGAWASRQSQPIAVEGDLERRVEEVTRRHEGASVPRPPHWSGFRVVPDRIEFWQGMPSRLHRREVYVRGEIGWDVEILYP